MKTIITILTVSLLSGCSALVDYGKETWRMNVPQKKTQPAEPPAPRFSLGMYIDKIRSRELKPGSEIYVTDSNYRVVQPTPGGYMLRHYADDPRLMPVILKTRREAFMNENLSEITVRLRYVGAESYTSVLLASRQAFVFEDVWDGTLGTPQTTVNKIAE